MAIIYSYPETTQILLTDMLIGTSTIRVAGKKKNLTKNFTIETLGGFIHDNFPTQWGEITGTLSNQTDLQAALDGKQSNITLTTIGTSGPSTFIDSILNIPNYTAAVPTKTSDLINDGEDGIHPFITAEDIPPSASTLNDVLTNGNISLLDANIGGLGLYDLEGSAYSTLTTFDHNFIFTDYSGNTAISFEQGVFSISKTNSIVGSFSTNLLTVSRGYNLPDAAGTIALTSDLTPYLLSTTAASTYYPIPTGTISQYIRGDGTFATFPTIPTVGTWGALNYPAWTTGTPFVKMTAVGTFALDTNTYLTGITSSDVTTALGYTPVTNARTLTINGVTYDLTADRSWTIPTNAGTVTSVGLSMPPAFTVSSSPITSAGTIAVAAAGTSAQYIRGDGQLATLPSSGGGGGSSVNYYLNGSVAASVATYKQLSNTAVIGAGTDFSITGNGLITQFLTDIGNPNRIQIPGGAWNFEMFFSMSSNGGTPKFYVELLKYDGVTFTTIANNSAIPETITGGTSIDLYLTSLAVPTTTLLSTDRLAIRVYVVGNSGGRTATLHTEDNHLCEIITTFSGGVTSLNGLTANTQYLAVGTTGTDFNISSVSETHTFNLPTASATNRGALSTTDWSAFNAKQNALTNPITGTGTTNYLPKFTGASTLGNSLIFDNGTNVGIGTSTPLSKLQVNDTTAFAYSAAPNVSAKIGASGTGGSFLVNTPSANSSYESGLAIDGTYTGGKSVININAFGVYSGGPYSADLAFKTSTNTTLSEKMRITNAGNVGIGTTAPAAKLQVNAPGALSTDIAFKIRNSADTSDLVLVDGTGNVGIGTTSGIFAKLDVNGTGRFIGSLKVSGLNEGYLIYQAGGAAALATYSANADTARFSFKYAQNFPASNNYTRVLDIISTGDSTGAGAIRLMTSVANSAPTTAMYLSPSGSIGIGTTAPTNAKLKVSGNSASGAIMSEDTTSTTSFVRVLGDISSQNLFNWQSGTALRFATSNQDYSSFAERMRITDTGNVGIGTTAPTSKLQVVGLVDYATNALAIAGGLTVGAFYHTTGVVKVVI